MKNKRMLKVLSTSFLLGSLVITSPSFAQIVNDDKEVNTFSHVDELQLGDVNVNPSVKASAKIPNSFKSDLRFSDFSQNFDLNTWFINNYVPATGYKDTYNNYEQVCSYTNYTFNLPTKDKNGNPEKFALSIGAAILHAGSGTDYENMALKHMNTGNDTFEKYSQVTGDLAHIYYKDKMKYNKDNAIKAIQTEQDGSYFGDTYKKSAGMTFNISDKFTKEMIIPSHKEAFTNKSTYMRDLKAVEKAAVDYYTQKYGKPKSKTFVIQTRDDYNGIRNITLPPNLSEDFYTEYGGLQVTSRHRFDKDLNQSFDEMALSAGTTFSPYHNHFFVLTDGKYKADPSLPYKQVKKDTSGKKQLMEFDEFFDNKVEKPDVLSKFKKALTSTYLNPNTISDKPLYHLVGNVEKITKETPYKTIKQNDSTLKAGETKVKVKGVKGKTEIIKTYEVVAQTGELKNPKESSKVISKPVDEIVLVGTMKAETKEEKKTETIAFEKETRNNPKLKKGEIKVIQKGVNGTKEITYKVYLENGKEVKREKVSEKVTKQPVKEITEVGTLETTIKNETKTETIKFEKETKENPKLKKGETKVAQKGVDGVKEITYKVTLENGKEVKREKVSEKVTKQPVKEIVEVGTLETTTKNETKTETVPFEKEIRNNSKLKKGETKVVQKGINGTKEITYKVTLENGKEVKREKVSEKVTKQPVKEITEVGTLETTTKEEKKTETVPFEKETRNNPKLKKGETKVVQKGVNGTKEITYKVTYENGKEVKREKVSEKITNEPVKEITEIGTLVSEVKEEKKTEDIKFKTIFKENPELKKDEKKVVTKGENGKLTVFYKVTYENGKEVKREKYYEEVSKEKVDEVIEVGTLVVETKDEEKSETVKFEKETKENPELKKGETKVIQKGEDGEKTVKYKVTYNNGKEVSREKISEKITKEPVKEITEVGTKVSEIKEVKEVEDIKFETITRENKNAPKGETKVVQKGAKGKKEITYKVILENGKEVSREKVSEQVVQDVLNEIIEVGTKEQVKKQEPKKETKQEKQAEKIEQTKKPEPKNLPKAGVEAEAPLLAGSLLSVISGLFISLKKKFK